MFRKETFQRFKSYVPCEEKNWLFSALAHEENHPLASGKNVTCWGWGKVIYLPRFDTTFVTSTEQIKITRGFKGRNIILNYFVNTNASVFSNCHETVSFTNFHLSLTGIDFLFHSPGKMPL